MIHDKQYILNRIKETAHQVDEGAEIILFGSRARGDSRPDSDWDISIITEKEVNKNYEEKMLDVFFHLQIELEIDINHIFRLKDAWEKPTAVPLYNEIKREGIKL